MLQSPQQYHHRNCIIILLFNSLLFIITAIVSVVLTLHKITLLWNLHQYCRPCFTNPHLRKSLAHVPSLKFQALRVATQYAPAPLLPRGRPSASRAAEQTLRSSTFARRIRSHADRCSRLTR